MSQLQALAVTYGFALTLINNTSNGRNLVGPLKKESEKRYTNWPNRSYGYDDYYFHSKGICRYGRMLFFVDIFVRMSKVCVDKQVNKCSGF